MTKLRLAVFLSALGSAGLSLPAPPVAQTAAAAAIQQTVVLSVENMTCALCPVTVKKAMQRVDGVKSVMIDFDAKTATVIFNPALVAAETVALASSEAGYPARPAE